MKFEINYNEFDKLVSLLEDIGAEYKVLPCWGGKQVKLFKNGKEIDDAVIHEFSHGAKQGLLETFRLSDCAGYETATEVFDGWERLMVD